MHNEVFFGVVVAMSALLLVANLLFLLSKKFIGIPFPVLLVGAGMIIAPFHLKIFESIELTPGLILFVLLPILLFESAFNFDFRVFKRIATPAFGLASVGLILTSLMVALPLYFFINLDFISAFLFGTIISSTDPVAILTILKSLGVPLKLNLLIDAESFFNDATSLVIFKILTLSLFATNSSSTTGDVLVSGLWNFIYVVIGGLVVGVALGLIFSKIVEFIKDARFVEIGMTIILAFLAFSIGEEVFHVSGVLSVLTAGLVMGNFGRSKFSPVDFEALITIWEFLVFLATSIVFILIGFKINLGLVFSYFPIVLLSLIVTLVARSVSVYLIGGLVNHYSSKVNKFPFKWLHILNWGGLKGVLPLALILSLPDAYEYKELFLIIAYGVVLFTITFNGMTIKWLVKKLKIDRIDRTSKLEINIIEMLIVKKLLKHFKWLKEIKEINDETYQTQIEKLSEEKKKLVEDFKYQYGSISKDKFDIESKKILLKYCLNLEKKTYKHLYSKRVITEPIYGKLAAKLTHQSEFIEFGIDQFKDNSSIDLDSLIPKNKQNVLVKLKNILFGDTIDTIEEFYMYHKARFLGNEFVIEELNYLGEEKLKVISNEIINEVRNIYTKLLDRNEVTLCDVEKSYPKICNCLNSDFCSAEAKNLIEDAIHKYGEDGRVSKRALQNIHIDF